MKLLLTNFHDGDGGGHTTYLITLAKHLTARHEIHIAAPGSSRLYREAQTLPGVHVIDQAFPNGLGHIPAAMRARKQMRGYLREQRFDIVHVNGSADHRLVLSALRGMALKPKLVWTKHNSKPMRGLGHWLRARRTDLVIAVSEATRRELSRTPYAQCRLVTVHNGVDTAHYTPWPADRVALEHARWLDTANNNIDTNHLPLLLGSNAGTADYKGWMDLLEALATLPKEKRDCVRVILCGKSPSTAQRAQIESLGLSSQVQFAGMLSDVRPVIAAIDVGFVLSYAVETISFACREMMAMGKPVLVSDYAGLPENITPDIDGWVVPVRDRAAIGQAILRLLDTRASLLVMGAAARGKAEREFDISRFVQGTETAYFALLT